MSKGSIFLIAALVMVNIQFARSKPINEIWSTMASMALKAAAIVLNIKPREIEEILKLLSDPEEQTLLWRVVQLMIAGEKDRSRYVDMLMDSQVGLILVEKLSPLLDDVRAFDKQLASIFSLYKEKEALRDNKKPSEKKA